MTTLNRLVLSWQGPSVVGSAVTVLHFDGSDNAAPPVAGILAALNTPLAQALPVGVVVTVPNSGDRIDDRTGSLTGVWSSSGGGNVTGAGGTNAAAGVGACIGWTTGGIVVGAGGLGRKLRGRTYIVPLHVGCYDAAGTLLDGIRTSLDTMAGEIMAAGPLAIWHRPTTKGGTDGNSYAVLTHKVRDKVAFLSSRRD